MVVGTVVELVVLAVVVGFEVVDDVVDFVEVVDFVVEVVDLVDVVVEVEVDLVVVEGAITEYDSVVLAAAQWSSVFGIAMHSAVYVPASISEQWKIALFPVHFTQSHSCFRPFAYALMQSKLWFFAGHAMVKPDSGAGDAGDTTGVPSPVFTGRIVVVTLDVEVVDVLMQ